MQDNSSFSCEGNVFQQKKSIGEGLSNSSNRTYSMLQQHNKYAYTVNTPVGYFLQVCRVICGRLLANLCAKSLTTLFTSKLRARLFSMLRIASPDSLSCDMELLRFV